jgi:hypothetical protein
MTLVVSNSNLPILPQSAVVRREGIERINRNALIVKIERIVSTIVRIFTSLFGMSVPVLQESALKIARSECLKKINRAEFIAKVDWVIVMIAGSVLAAFGISMLKVVACGIATSTSFVEVSR